MTSYKIPFTDKQINDLLNSRLTHVPKSLKLHTYSDEVATQMEYLEMLNYVMGEFPAENVEVTKEGGVVVYHYFNVVGSGVLSLNPTLLIASVKDKTTSVMLTAYAKEGLGNQNSAKKAVTKFITKLNNNEAVIDS